MKKTLLLATTAIVSAFAFNVKANAPTVEIQAKAKVVSPSVLESIQELDFGTVAYHSGARYTVSKDGTAEASGDYAQMFGTPSVGKIKLRTALRGASEHYSLLLPQEMELKFGQNTCGTVSAFSQATPTFVNIVDGVTDYEIAFGGTFTMSDTLEASIHHDGAVCSGSATATLVYTE